MEHEAKGVGGHFRSEAIVKLALRAGSRAVSGAESNMSVLALHRVRRTLRAGKAATVVGWLHCDMLEMERRDKRSPSARSHRGAPVYGERSNKVRYREVNLSHIHMFECVRMYANRMLCSLRLFCEVPLANQGGA